MFRRFGWMVLFSLPCTFCHSEEALAEPIAATEEQKPQTVAVQAFTPFTPFTGKVLRDRVRLRLQPTLDGVVFQEMSKEDLLVATGETDDFYAVQALPHTKAYVFRTYILDGVVEGHHVNVRLQPDVEAPILAQLNEGEKIEGQISLTNPKWLEIEAPSSVRFYVYKDYVENIGDEHVYTIVEARREEVNRLLETAYEKAEDEFTKDFVDINAAGIVAQLNHIIRHYEDFSDQVEAAKKELQRVEELVLQRKIAYLEGREESSQTLAHRNKQLSSEVVAKEERIHLLENRLLGRIDSGEPSEMEAEGKVAIHVLSPDNPYAVTHRMMGWFPQEEELFSSWLIEQEGGTLEDFYSAQQQGSVILHGIVESYDRPLNNKPGDFVLINKETKLPLAFLYSTRVNLEAFVGQELSVDVSSRPNHHFAYPAYYVLDIQDSTALQPTG